MKAVLTEGPVGKTLIKLTIPMMVGLVGMIIFNLVDVFFIGRYGTMELAALSFTFPVVILITSLALGVGVGVAAAVSRAVGEKDKDHLRRLTTDSLILSIVIGAVFVVIGITTIRPVFSALGASEEVLRLIRSYMIIWYPGMFFIVIPMVGNNAIRALGDTVTPSVIMMIAVLLNIVLDPLMIFGIKPFPRMGLAGAALATLIARAATLFFSLWVLVVREKLITLKRTSWAEILRSWEEVLFIGLPTAATRAIIPVATAVITRMLATYGPEAVAAFGVAAKIEFFAMVFVFALASVVGPFIGQNLGANKPERVRKCVKYSEDTSLIWGIGVFILLALFSRPLGGLFSNNSEVIRRTTQYLRIVPVGYAMYGIMTVSVATLNVIKKPYHSSMIMIIQMFVLYVPLAMICEKFFGVIGIFMALSIAYIIGGTIGHRVLRREMSLI
ncbi:MAG: MATE family efflux transporter [Candidatus Omnitrophica bacterium]|nr:MATE family efflux transporter [Candidatus Omnitrophota bacterium]MDD5488734.1 MATE family efflux transporter [Candidatus Omnitrophota bacterium]